MDNNPYRDEMAQATEYLRLTLALLATHQIAPSPAHFRLGYDICAGRNEALKEAIEKILSTPEPDTQDALWALYKRTYVQDDKALDIMRQELRRIIVTVKGEFEQSGAALSTYSHTLNQFVELLEEGGPPEFMAAEVDKIIEKTRSAEMSQRSLSAQLTQIVSEVQSLRDELEYVRRESLTDALTGISNRKAFDSTLEHMVREARDAGSPFCILLADIDHFKKINDTHGHLVGDKILRFVAATIKRCIKGKDLVARYGGEEFGLLLPHTDLDSAHTVAEQIRQTVSSGKLKDKSNQESYGRVTISIGVAQFTVNDLPNTLVQRADRALYQAKERGRDRVVKSLDTQSQSRLSLPA